MIQGGGGGVDSPTTHLRGTVSPRMPDLANHPILHPGTKSTESRDRNFDL